MIHCDPQADPKSVCSSARLESSATRASTIRPNDTPPDSVPALKNNSGFRKKVEDGTFDAWAMKMSAVFDKSGVGGTPTLRMDGKKLSVGAQENPPLTVEDFNTVVDKALKG